MTGNKKSRRLEAQQGGLRFDVIHGRVPDDGRNRKLSFTSVCCRGKYFLWYDTKGRLVLADEQAAVTRSLLDAHQRGEYWLEDPHFKDSHQTVVWQVRMTGNKKNNRIIERQSTHEKEWRKRDRGCVLSCFP